MFELVIEDRGGEYVAFKAEKEREVELIRQRHVRSLTEGLASIREAKPAKKAKK
ncbi:hypothetical protein [Pseudodesulfovibrio portus]|jgi:hypothetical protein|uniref:Uncharacterized protein n=1 Tax=Pseudodesulfovibrio portus TaxID=231439 RepID=A0ABN6RS98_9BACT|nr:hypothetical protein [Pseudodesulfovibrio portus]BDQ33942.1 hypothetical protein JCM14722_14840 [Pseudodesulfovibrio portus]